MILLSENTFGISYKVNFLPVAGKNQGRNDVRREFLFRKNVFPGREVKE